MICTRFTLCDVAGMVHLLYICFACHPRYCTGMHSLVLGRGYVLVCTSYTMYGHVFYLDMCHARMYSDAVHDLFQSGTDIA